MIDPTELPTWALYALAAIGLAVLLLPTAYWAGGRRTRRKVRRAVLAAQSGDRASKTNRTSRGDLLAAAIATAVSAEGMWTTFDALDVQIWLRVVMFAFIEINVVQCARRARRAMQQKLAEIAAGKTWEKASSGVDGIAMWVLTCVSAGLSVAHELTVDNPNLAVVLVRLVAPLVAAWAWERHMALERRASGLRKAINWTVTLERLAIRVGIAEPAERTVTQVDVDRRLHRVAVAAARLNVVDGPGRHLPGARRRATARFRARMREALEHTDLATSPERQAQLDAETAALTMASSFAAMNRRPFWMPPPPAAGARVRICCGKAGPVGTVPLWVQLQGKPARRLLPAPPRRESATLASLRARMRGAGEDRQHGIRTADRTATPAVPPAARTEVRSVPRRATPRTADRPEVTRPPIRNAHPYARTAPARTAPSLTLVPSVRSMPVRRPDGLALLTAPARTYGGVPGTAAPARTSVRTQVTAPVDPAPAARVRPEATADDSEVEQKTRDEWIETIAEEIRTAREQGGEWKPKYEVLQRRTGFKQSWCEKAVREAKVLAAQPRTGAVPDAPAPAPRTGTEA
ncbi:hypothetical protein [Actinomadura sp. LOL_011]|uniref:hypothetical protein n=1 Tax=Actinomadura sp. LOL_011 TaxID=3345410 RepID=UPI003A810B2B